MYFVQLCTWQILSCHPESVPKSLAKSWRRTCSCHSITSLFFFLQPCSKPLFEIPPVLLTPELATFLRQDKELCLTKMSSTVPFGFYFFISIFMQLFVTLLWEISTEIPSSRATLGHEVCKTKCDLIRCDFVWQFPAPAFYLFSCSSVEQHLTCLHSCHIKYLIYKGSACSSLWLS